VKIKPEKFNNIWRRLQRFDSLVEVAIHLHHPSQIETIIRKLKRVFFCWSRSSIMTSKSLMLTERRVA